MRVSRWYVRIMLAWAMIVLMLPVISWAQGAAPVTPSTATTILSLVAAVVTSLGSYAGPYLTMAIHNMVVKLPANVAPLVSAVGGLLAMSLTAAFTGTSVDPNTTVAQGLLGGVIGHALLQTAPVPHAAAPGAAPSA